MTSSKKIIPIKHFHPDKHPVKHIGGKARNLGHLHHKGFKIPESYVVPTESFKNAITELQIPQKLVGANFDKLADISQEIEQAIVSKVGQRHINDLFPTIQEHIKEHPKVSVRSSATAEDSGEHSFAGQFSSVLNVPTVEKELRKAITAVWQSTFSLRALAYALAKDVNLEQLHMATIFQQMISARTAGTMFTVDIENDNDPHTLLIQAASGLGEAIVDGTAEATTYRINKTSHKITSVEGEPLLTDSEIQELVNIGMEIERAFNSAQDIEWAIDESGLWLLQTRPITT